MRRRPRVELTHRVERLEERRGVRKCGTCVDWPDVIELHRGVVGASGPGAFPAEWGPWAEHLGICPGCGRAPLIYQVVMHIDEAPAEA
jgi:hypothetical protein